MLCTALAADATAAASPRPGVAVPAGWAHTVYYQPKKKFVHGTKDYGTNFSWDKRCRNNTK